MSWCESRALEWRSVDTLQYPLGYRHVVDFLTGTLVGAKLFLIGQFMRFNDLASTPNGCVVYWMDTRTFAWSTKELTGPNVYGHSTVLTRDRLVIIGGLLGDSTINMKIWSLDLTMVEFTTLQTSGVKVRSRAYHSGEFIEKREQVVVFGGYNVLSNSCLNDVVIFDLKKLAWQVPKVTGEKPSCRARQSSCMLRQTMFVYGGQNAIHEAWDTLSDLHLLHCGRSMFTWSSPRLQGFRPVASFAATLSHIRGKLILYGGQNGGVPLSTLFIYDLRERVWERCGVEASDSYSVTGTERKNLAHTAVVVNETLMVLGGRGAPLALCRVLQERPPG